MQKSFSVELPKKPSQRVFRPLWITLVLAAAVLPGSTARGGGLDRRPCGPDSMTGPLRLLVPQGVYGADFRPACRRHDACYDTPGTSKAACDRAYRAEMRSACANSRTPRLCRLVAGLMHRATVRRGDQAFASAQRIAMSLQSVVRVNERP